MSDPTAPSARASATRRAVVFGVGVALFVSIVVTALVVTSTADGATGPEAAARDFLAATAHGDIAAVVDQLPPGERDALRDELPGLAQELTRLGVAPPLGVSPWQDVSVDITGLQLLTEMASPEVGRVQLVDGDLTIDPGRASPLLVQLAPLVGGAFVTEVDPLRTPWTIHLADHAPTLMTVKDAGGWHVSLLATIAEAARTRGGQAGPAPRFGGGPVDVGGTTPEGAVEDLFTAAETLNPTAAVQLLLPTEARPLYDYATVFLPEAQREAEARAAQDGAGPRVTRLETVVEGDGGTRTVRITALEAERISGGERTVVSYDGRCATTTAAPVADDAVPPETTTRCAADQPKVVTNGEPDAATFFGGLLRGIPGGAFPTYTVVEKNGRWYLSPIRTVLGTLQERLHQLPDDALVRDPDALHRELSAVWELWLGLAPGPQGSVPPSEPAS